MRIAISLTGPAVGVDVDLEHFSLDGSMDRYKIESVIIQEIQNHWADWITINGQDVYVDIDWERGEFEEWEAAKLREGVTELVIEANK